jgi:hypothetical protein
MLRVGKRCGFRGQKVQSWTRILIRSFGIANWFYGLTGSYFLINGLRRTHRFGTNLYEAEAYYFYVAINALFLFALFLAGYWLILIRRRGAILSNYVFAMEILFFVLSSLVSLHLAMSSSPRTASVGMSLGATAGIGNMGTALQILTAYPLIALVALNLARRSMDRTNSWNVFRPSQLASRTRVNS